MAQEKAQQPWYIRIISTRWRRVGVFTALFFVFLIIEKWVYSFFNSEAHYMILLSWTYPFALMVYLAIDTLLDHAKKYKLQSRIVALIVLAAAHYPVWMWVFKFIVRPIHKFIF